MDFDLLPSALVAFKNPLFGVRPLQLAKMLRLWPILTVGKAAEIPVESGLKFVLYFWGYKSNHCFHAWWFWPPAKWNNLSQKKTVVTWAISEMSNYVMNKGALVATLRHFWSSSGNFLRFSLIPHHIATTHRSWAHPMLYKKSKDSVIQDHNGVLWGFWKGWCWNQALT